jgi:hypothetical protein
MKRRDLMQKLREMAAAEGRDLVESEGGSHTKVTIGDRQSVVPRHREINELTARAILKQLAPTTEED